MRRMLLAWTLPVALTLPVSLPLLAAPAFAQNGPAPTVLGPPGRAQSVVPNRIVEAPEQRALSQPGTAPSKPVATAPRFSLTVEAGSGRVFQTSRSIANLFAADPKVAEVRPASPTSVFVFGVAPGRTTVAAMDEQGGVVAQYDVTVRPSSFGSGEATAAIHRVLPDAGVRVETTTGGLVARGDVATPAEADQVMTILRGYLPTGQKAENRLSVASAMQVNLRVRVAEVSRSVIRQIGVNWSVVGAVGTKLALAGTVIGGLTTATALPNQLAVGYVNKGIDLNAIIDLLAQDGLVTILAEPNLTAISGQTASFLAGGEFPIPIAQINNAISVDFKQYGVSLAFVPTVLSPGRISMRVRPEVSELSDQGAVSVPTGNGGTLVIPALTVRRADTTVELGSGQSFAIAGLLQGQSRFATRALPWLGELPVLGALFRSNKFQRDETELVILITPYLVRPVSDPGRLTTPTDDFVPANDLERVFFMRQRAFGTGPDRTVQVPGNVGFLLD